MPIELVTISYHLILCCPFLLLPSIFPSIGVFSSESALPIRWPQDCSFSISPSNEYSGLASFSVDWFDLAVPTTLRVFSSTTVRKHQFFCAQLSLWSNSHIRTWLLGKPQLWRHQLEYHTSITDHSIGFYTKDSFFMKQSKNLVKRYLDLSLIFVCCFSGLFFHQLIIKCHVSIIARPPKRKHLFTKV